MMTNKTRKLPIGIQTFESIRNEGYVYVDKTEYVYKLAHEGKAYFLSRPRRFGKSLLLSTMKTYFEGKKELFSGLAIERLEAEEPDAWTEYPLFYFDFTGEDYSQKGGLEQVLNKTLIKLEQIYGTNKQITTLSGRFHYLLESAHEQTGKRVVVLVDEYDKPLLETDHDKALQESNRALFKGFFGNLKGCDEHLKFVFITGVTRFSKVSIFSDLNHLNDISNTSDYACICGITQSELEESFKQEISTLAALLGMDNEDCISALKKKYDGYHFEHASEDTYNPFSLLNAFQKCKLDDYWFSTGTPTFLINRIKDAQIDVREFTENTIYASGNDLKDYRDDNPNPIPLLYQSGYLTIKDYRQRGNRYTLGFPNDEVKYGFLESLVPAYLSSESANNPLDIFAFDEDIENGKIDSFMNRFTALFASIPYPDDDRAVEYNFQITIYLVFKLLGQFVKAEVHSSTGRADCILECDDYIYVFEFKRDKSAAEAMQQIQENGYDKPYASDPRKLFMVGVNFDSKKRSLEEWMVEGGSYVSSSTGNNSE